MVETYGIEVYYILGGRVISSASLIAKKVFSMSLSITLVFWSRRSTSLILLDFSLSVKAAPHECVIRTGQLQT